MSSLSLFELSINIQDNTIKKDISLEQIDQTPIPQFPHETKLATQATSTLPSIPTLSTPPGAAGPTAPGSSLESTGLSDPNLVNKISTRFGGGGLEETEYVTSKGVTKEQIVKAIKEAAHVPRSASFEIFNRNHLKACDGLIQILYYISVENIPTALSYAKQFVNEELLNYCINVIGRHRPEYASANVPFPSHITSHPSTYVDVSKLDSILYAREVSADETQVTKPIEINSFYDFTATDADPEHKVAYFREDVGINLHHRHWHEVYPNTGPKEVTNMDRRGELFVYMHGQILARYNFERLCNALDPVKKFSNFKEPIMEAYYPKLDEASEVKVWSPRQPFAQLQDVYRDGLIYEVTDLERWLERLVDSIDRGFVIKKEDGNEVQVKLEEPNAINDLGNTIDAVPNLSYNYDYYGDLHTVGHILIAYCHDPDKRFRELGGVMGKLEAALRDPMFYRWHAFIDDVMDRYKKKLRQYSVEEREFQGITIDSVTIDSGIAKKNIIQTFWQEDRVDVTDGILSLKQASLTKRPSKVYVKFRHLQHKDFTYKFRVYNMKSKTVTGVVRIFMAPEKDETRNKMAFNKLRRYMIELDKFTVNLKFGVNEFTRKSTCSAVTVPFEQSFMTLEKAKTYATDPAKTQDMLSYCGCGWPHHLLVGRGRESGYPCTLFVMITDYEKDKVPDSSIESCGNSSISYCGVRNKKFPDKRPMGFPFDRPIEDTEADLDIFMTKSQKSHDVGADQDVLKNMYKTEFKIEYHNKIEQGQTCEDNSCSVPAKQ